MKRLTRTSLITFHDLAVRRQNADEVLVGRPDICRYVLLLNEGYDIIERLARKETIADIELSQHANGSEPDDIYGFVEELLEQYSFVHQIDGVTVSEPVLQKRHFAWIPERAAKLMFHPSVFIAAAVMLLMTSIFLFVHPAHMPAYTDFMTGSSLTWNITLALLVAWSLLFLHELMHVAAARSLGVYCRLGLGHRLLFPVAETDMTNIVLVPEGLRYRAFLAGMLFDTLCFAAGIWLQELSRLGLLALDGQLLVLTRMVLFHVMTMLLFQFLFFMKTDIYYAFTAFLRCERLLENTHVFLRLLVRKARRTDREDWEAVAGREKRIIYGYACFYIVGMLCLLIMIGMYAPLFYSFYESAAGRLLDSPAWSWLFIDALLLLTMNMVPVGALLLSWFNKLKELRSKGGDT